MHELWLSIGRHRRETNWKNKPFTWPELLQKLSNTQRTGETVKDYAAMDKDNQDAIKDIGGFVGGAITGGRRKKGAVTSRSLITLDVDTAGPDFWDLASLTFDCAMCVYSTHKHTPDNPRLRLVIPLAEEVPPDQYQAIGRKIAGSLGIDQFDPTTFQPERLMYWPSTPKDGVYLFEQQDGEFLTPGVVLAKYKDWRDSSQWPMHSREREHVREGVQQAADPTEKTGVVGAFCRVYGIEAVIAEFLSDVYETAGEGRYTYKHGSTAGGLVVYSDRWAYSHHGTDPVSGQLCNAFDLVRIHKFGRLDDRVREDTPINRRQSHLAMCDLARKDQAVNLDLVRQQLDGAAEAFKDIDASGEWLQLLETDRKGKIAPTSDNIRLILENDLKGCFALNIFNGRKEVLKDLPWRPASDSQYYTDTDEANLRIYLETTYKFTTPSKIKDVINSTFYKNKFHPVRDYLEGLRWDGEGRLDTLLIDYAGAEDNEYVRAVTRKTLTAAVARIFNPGCKFDYVLTLVGEQGKGKSRLLATLANGWFSDSLTFHTVGTRKAIEQLQGHWIMELGEMTGLKKADMEEAKSFITRQEDRDRMAYAEQVSYFPRQCIFIGTTNKDEFLRDETGNRRFWPVAIDSDMPAEMLAGLPVDQIWAEAIHFYKQGEKLYLTKELEEMAKETQKGYSEYDEREGQIRRFLNMKLPDNWGDIDLPERKSYIRGDETLTGQPIGTARRDRVCALEIYLELFDGNKANASHQNMRFIYNIMRNIEGWKRTKKAMRIPGFYGVAKGYIRG